MATTVDDIHTEILNRYDARHEDMSDEELDASIREQFKHFVGMFDGLDRKDIAAFAAMTAAGLFAIIEHEPEDSPAGAIARYWMEAAWDSYRNAQERQLLADTPAGHA